MNTRRQNRALDTRSPIPNSINQPPYLILQRRYRWRQIFVPVILPHRSEQVGALHRLEIIRVPATSLPVDDAGDHTGSIRLTSSQDVRWPEIAVREDDPGIFVAGEEAAQEPNVACIGVAVMRKEKIGEFGCSRYGFRAVPRGTTRVGAAFAGEATERGKRFGPEMPEHGEILL